MNCNDAQFYLRFRRPGADELDPDAAAALDRHLAGCRVCGAAADAGRRFDAAVGAAVRDVPVPEGLRNRLIAHVAERRGADLRRRAYRYASGAAAVLLVGGLALGWFGRRPVPDLYAITVAADRGAADPEQAVADFLAGQKLPRDLPVAFDFTLNPTCRVELVQGEPVPVVEFHGRQPGQVATVYAFRESRFNGTDLQGLELSNATATVLKDQSPRGVVYVVVHTTPDLRPFLRPHGART